MVVRKDNCCVMSLIEIALEFRKLSGLILKLIII